MRVFPELSGGRFWAQNRASITRAGRRRASRRSAMPQLRVCSFNIEWMNDWFEPGNGPAAFRQQFQRDGHLNDTHTTATRAAAVIAAIDADIVAVQEAASRKDEVELFVHEYLGGTYEVLHGDSGASQKLALLYKPIFASAALTLSADIQMIVQPWLCDTNGDAMLDEYAFTRTPLCADFTIGAHQLRVIVMHTKSNFVNNGKAMWNNQATRQNYVVAALQNRRRNSAEGSRMRAYLDSLLAGQPTRRVIVLGDLNDGPGRDYFEDLYLTHNVTDAIVGSSFEPERLFAHAQHDVVAADRYTAVFDDFVTGENGKQLLLDHILLSPGFRASTGLRAPIGSGTIHHAQFLAQTVNGGQHREDRPSDHRPVSVQLQY
jgi:endonuclease/exonuclease/phosphatase family metal-dependent hydrolase